MPAEGNTNLLLSMGLDLSPVHSAAETVKTTLNSLNTLAEQVKATATAAASSQSAEMKQLRDAAQQAVLLAKEAVAQAKGQTANLSVQNAELKNQLVTQQALVKTSQANLLDEKARTVEIQRQTAEYRLQELQKKASGGGASGGVAGALGGLGGQVSKGLLGGGLAGGVAGGLLAGAGVAGLIMAAGEALSGFITKMKEVTLESGKLTILEDVFHGLARGAGVDATAMMQKMQTATEGLVSKVTLLKAANTELRSPLHLTTDQISQLMSSVTKLSEAAGNTAETGITRLNMAFLRGRPMILSTVLGVQGLRDVMRDMPPGLSAAERTTLQWTRALKILNDQAAKLGELPVTLEQMETRMHVASQNVMLGFGQGFGESTGMQTFIKTIDGMILKFGGLETVAKKMGEGLGNMFGSLSALSDTFVQTLHSLGDAFADVGKQINNVLNYAFASGTTANNQFIQSFRDFQPVLDAFGQTMIGIAGTVKTVANAIQFLASQHNIWTAAGDWKAGQNRIAAETNQASLDFEERGGETQAGSALKDRTQMQMDAIDQVAAKKKDAAQKDFAAHKISVAQLSTLEKQAIDDAATARKTVQAGALTQEIANINKVFDYKKQKAVDDAKSYGALVPIAIANLPADIEKQRQTAIDQATYRSQHPLKTIDPNKPASTGATPQEKAKEAQALMQERMEQAKVELDAKKRGIAVEKELDDEKYKYEQESLELHYANMHKIAEENRDATKDEAKAAFDATMAELDEQKKDQGMKQAVYQEKELTAAMKYNDAKLAADSTFDMSELKMKDDHLKDLQEAHLKGIQDTLKEQNEVTKRGESANQAGLNQGTTDPDTYMKNQLAFIREKADHEIAAADQVYAVNQGHADALRVRAEAVQAAVDEAIDKVNQLQVSEASVRLAAVEKKFQPQQQYIQAQIGGLQPGQSPNALHEQLVASLKDENNLLEVQLHTQTPLTTGWYTIAAKIAEVNTQIAKTNLELAKSADLMTPLADVLKSMSGLMDSIWSSKFVKGLSGGMQGGISALSGSQSAGTTIAAALNPPKENGDDMTTRFSKGLTAAIGELTDFASALSKSTTAVGGMLAGGVGGAGLGQTANLAMSGMGGMMGTMSSFMPAIGAAVGAVMGTITGQKNAEMSSELSQMNSQYTSLMDAFHANTDNLQVTINELQNLMAEAAEEQANSKKGGQAFGSLISQYSQELSQLQDQQSSIISSLETQLAIFDTPTGMQQFLTNLDTIIQQYDKFAGAAENASQLAQANSWLTDSLSSYTAQMENTFVNDEEGGISDALQLNSLLSERSTMISQLGNSIQNVLEQGVLTRQQTGAQKKGQQIYQLESAASLQMTSINNEISLETYKVGIETSLYNLGMTSMALQGQLLVLQEAQASQSLASISALQTLMDTLNGGGYSGTLSSILTLLGYGAAAGNIPAGTTTSPYGPIGGTPIGGLDALVSAAYQSRATLGYAGFRGSNI